MTGVEALVIVLLAIALVGAGVLAARADRADLDELVADQVRGFTLDEVVAQLLDSLVEDDDDVVRVVRVTRKGADGRYEISAQVSRAGSITVRAVERAVCVPDDLDAPVGIRTEVTPAVTP